MDQVPHAVVRHQRRWFRFLLILLAVGLVSWTQRDRILRSIGSFLIEADTDCHADVLYVLGGAPYDRGTEASRLLERGCVGIAYCTGSNIQQAEKAQGIMLTEADLTRAAAIHSGADPRRILPFRYGTSTKEEAEGALRHAKSLGVDTVLVLSTEFHTRRVGKVFRKRFAGSGIVVKVHAAPSTEYDPNAWWHSEQGLLMVNNEYVKTLYYALKY